jgi:hypothetical protein
VNLPCEFDDSGIIIETLRSIDRGGPKSGPLWPCSLPEAKSSARISVAAAILCMPAILRGRGRAHRMASFSRGRNHGRRFRQYALSIITQLIFSQLEQNPSMAIQ